MQRIKARVSIPYILAVFGVCVFLLGSSIKSYVGPKQFDPTVKLAVSKLEIIEMKMLSPNVIQVFMRNGYSKDITAVVTSIGERETNRRDYIFAEGEEYQKLSPEAIDDFLYGIDSKEEENIVIKAVLFSDMTIDGDPREIRKVLDKRLGFKIQLGRFNSHLESLNKVGQALFQKEFQKLRQFAENLPIKPDGDFPMSHYVESGLRHGREFIRIYLSKLYNQFENGNNLVISNNKESMNVKYERFLEYSLRVEDDFKSLESRL